MQIIITNYILVTSAALYKNPANLGILRYNRGVIFDISDYYTYNLDNLLPYEPCVSFFL